MSKQVFINLPVANLPKSLEFFKALGYSHNPQYTDDTAACVVISVPSIGADEEVSETLQILFRSIVDAMTLHVV